MNASERKTAHSCRQWLRRVQRYADGLGLFTVLSALAAVGTVVTEWMALPLLLYGLETRLPLETLMLWVIALTLLMMMFHAFRRYTEGAFSERRDCFRTHGCTVLAHKAFSAAYTHIVDPDRIEALRRSTAAMGRHINAPLPRLWEHLSCIGADTVCACLFILCLVTWDPTAATVTALTALCSAVVHRAVSEWTIRREESVAAAEATLRYVRQMAESAEHSKDIRVFGLSGWFRALQERSMQALYALFRKRSFVCFLFNVADAVLTLIRNVFAYSLLLFAVSKGFLSLSHGFLCFAAVGGFTHCVSNVCERLWLLSGSLRALREYADILTWEELPLDEKAPMPREETVCISCRKVSYKDCLKDVSFTVRNGEVLGIVGEDERAQAILARLLCGLLDPTEGAVLCNGEDVRTPDRRRYYERVSAVLRGTTVSDVTVEEFIGGDTVEESRLYRCLETVRFDLTSMPHGVKTHIGRTAFESGVAMSGGRLQRLLLARALYKDGQIWILEEPQTALDPLAERDFLSDIRSLNGGKTTVLLSGRPSLMRGCDRILYVKDGVISEEGTHDELMKKDGDYARLFRLQHRLYGEGREAYDEASLI
ncbi:MAG: ABC transporter ATP-binding protein [Clostridia bacterium]|nr:ABC transporter ATP-binding protein [Clostridia bacterium]